MLTGTLNCSRTPFFAIVIVTLLGSANGEDLVNIQFSRGTWDRAVWTDAKSAHYARQGNWVQEPDHVRNAVPSDATPEQMLSKRAEETHACFIHDKLLKGDVTIESTVSFDHRMAPAIVLTPKLVPLEKGQHQYESHIQVVLFDKGINVWHGDWAKEKFTWSKIAYARFDVPAKKRHKLTMKKMGKSIEVSVNGEHTFGFMTDVGADSFHTGLIACEGINRFYSFRVSK